MKLQLPPQSVCAVIPTRGNVDVGAIVNKLRSFPEIGEIRFPIGSTPFNRYLAMEQSAADVTYTQDDDCVTDIGPLLEAYEPGLIVNAMTPEHAEQYRGAQTLIGFGALFSRGLIHGVLDISTWKRDELFYRESDRVFATINTHKTVFPSIEILPHAHDANRLWKQPDHNAARVQMNKRILQLTGIEA